MIAERRKSIGDLCVFSFHVKKSSNFGLILWKNKTNTQTFRYI